MDRKSYPGGVTDEEWEFCAPDLTLMKEDAPRREHSLREVLNGLRSFVRAGRPWRMMPNDLPPRITRCCRSLTEAMLSPSLVIATSTSFVATMKLGCAWTIRSFGSSAAAAATLAATKVKIVKAVLEGRIQ